MEAREGEGFGCGGGSGGGEMQDNMKQYNIHIIGISEREEEE